jgi:hypothetical protein
LPGYPINFANKIGLIESGLGGKSSASPQVPGNNDDEEVEVDQDTGIPFGDEEEEAHPPQPPTPPPRASKPANTDFDFEELFRTQCIVSGNDDEMRIKAIKIDDVPVLGDVAKQRDLVVVQAVLPPGAVLDTFKIQPDKANPSNGTASVDIDANVCNADKRMKSSWIRNNFTLSNLIRGGLDSNCSGDEDFLSLPTSAFQLQLSWFQLILGGLA